MSRSFLYSTVFIVFLGSYSQSHAGGGILRNWQCRALLNSTAIQVPNQCVPTTHLCVKDPCAPSCVSEVSMACQPDLTRCCEIVEKAAVVSGVGNDSRKLDGLRWDMIKIKQQVQVQLSAEEQAIASKPRPE